MNGAPRPKSKQGCLGCLGRLIVILLLGGLLIVAIDAVFAPWSFFLGGHFHYMPMWQGWGRVHTASGDYALAVQMSPSSSGSRSGPTVGYPHVSGNAWLCTPRGEKFRLRLYGMFADKSIGIHPDGHAISLSMHRIVSFQTGPDDYKPEVAFHGTWNGDSLVGDDQGSFAQAFAPDGHVYKHGEQRVLKETVPLTFKGEVFWLGTPPDFDAACAQVRK